MSTVPPPPEVTLRELILRLQGYGKYLWRQKFWMLLAGLLGASYFAWSSWQKNPVYIAELTYMVNEDDGGQVAGVGSILGQFGLGGGEVASDFNLEKIVALSRSQRIINAVLLDSMVFGGEVDLLANHLIELYGFRKRWEQKGDTDLANFSFRAIAPDSLSRRENGILKQLYRRVVGNQQDSPLLRSDYAEETGILSIRTRTDAEEVTLFLADRIYEELSSFYIEKSTEKQRESFQRLAARMDSVSTALKNAEYRLARYQDQSLGVIQRRDQVQQDQILRDVQLLTLMYGETFRNKEAASFLLDNATPFFQVIDGVSAPLPWVKESPIRSGAFGFLLGGIVISLFLIGRQIYLDIMRGD